jgi:L-lactate dehydrogenase
LEKIIITVIGVGNVGKCIANLLLTFQKPLTINLIDPDARVEGLFLDLVTAGNVTNIHEIHLNNYQFFTESDFVFHTAGAKIPLGADRDTVVKESIELTQSIFTSINFVKQPKVIVIANPVEVITYFTYVFSGLPKENVVGTGTYVDAIRFNYFASLLLKVKSSDVESYFVGEHGKYLVPLFSKIHIQQNNILTLLSKNEIDNLVELTKKTALEIKKTQDSTIYGVAWCAVDVFKQFLYENQQILTISVLPNKENSALLNHSKLAISLPVKIVKGEVKQISNWTYTKEEQRQLLISANNISKHIF